jgi:excisionase family DNA binding protein
MTVGKGINMEQLLTSNEAARILRIHPKVLERKAKAGEIPALKVGKFWRYRASALELWVETQIHSKCQPCRIEPSF